ncbi:MAG: PAS domain-containing protein [Candidatus Omnitrophica bacterium]|nr:PAS domain-containing protein [Candidatus Omnitrophota bacterium]
MSNLLNEETTTALEELRAKLGRLEVALSAIADPLVWVDAGGTVQWCNAPFRRLVGRPEEALLGAMLIDLLPLEDRGKRVPPAAHPVHLALRGQPNALGSYEFLKGDQRLMLDIFAALVQFSKHEVNMVVAIHDVTERKAAEEKERALAETARAAASAARKRAAELNIAYKELKSMQAMLVQAEKMAAVGQLASGIAHEVKNPLGIILHGVNYLEQALGPSTHSLHEVLQMIKDAVMRSDKIVRDLLNFSRQAPLESRICHVTDVLEASLGLVEKQLGLANIQLTKAFAPELPSVLIDENQMKQVFINLLVNALQAMPKGGTLLLRTSTRLLTERHGRVGRRATDAFRPGEAVVVCEVTDTGVGIPRDKLREVFNPFFTTKPAGQGTGLGLAITQSIVEKHGGLVTLESEIGHGTTASVMLPVARRTLAKPTQATKGVHRRRRPAPAIQQEELNGVQRKPPAARMQPGLSVSGQETTRIRDGRTRGARDASAAG